MVQTRSGRTTCMKSIQKGDCSECDEYFVTCQFKKMTSSEAKTCIINVYDFLMHMKYKNHVRARTNPGKAQHRLYLVTVSKLNEFKKPKYDIVEFCEYYLNLIEQTYKAPDDYNANIKDLMEWMCHDRQFLRHEIVDNILCEYVVGVPLREL